MLKFENIIKNLRLEEKVNLITNSGVLGNKTIPHYELPTFTVTTTNNSNATNTILPTYLQLAQTWNEELVDKCGEEVARNAIFAKNKTLIGVPTSKSSFGDDVFSSSEYLVGKIAAAYVRGIRNGGAIACLNKAPLSSNLSETEYRNNDLLSTEIAVKEGKVNAIISEGLDCLDLLRETYYKGLLICEASTSSDLISSIYEGNHLTLIQGFDAVKAVKDAIEAYERASYELSQEQISQAQFDTMQRNGDILDAKDIDIVLDGLLYFLVSYVEKFNEDGEVISSEVLKSVAEESVVLVKNNNTLPLDTDVSVALIGQQVVKPVMNFNTKVIADEKQPITFYNKYGFNLVGHAYGYHSDVKKQEELIEEAVSLAKKARYSIVYLGVSNKDASYQLPIDQLNLITRLYKENVKMIAVVAAPTYIDFSFTDMFEAVILTGENTFETIETAVEIILGLVNPGGRLTVDIPYSVDSEGNRSTGIKYPIGTGLSYSPFTYRQFKVLHNGVSFTVENEGEYRGSDVLSLYVSRVINGVESTKELKGFVKVTLSSRNYEKRLLSFNEYTFRTYDEKLECYGVSGGVYKLTLGHTLQDVVYETEINLDESYDNTNAYEFEVVDKSSNALNRFVEDNKSKWDYAQDVRGMSFKKKVFISTLLYAYALIFSLVIGLSGGENVFRVFAVIALIVTIIYIVFLVKSKKKEKQVMSALSRHPINDMVNELGGFRVLNKEEYEVNQKPKVEKEEIQEVKVEEKPVQEVKVEEVIEYSHCDFELKEDSVEYSNDVDFGVLCNNFNEYALKNGLIVEQASIRLLISSICSSKLVFLRSVRMDLLPKLVNVLNSFLGNEEFIFDVKEIENNSLIWKTQNGKYVQTEFVQALHQAKKYRNHLNVIALNNVNVDTMNDYFSDFFRYCKAPKVSCNINLGSDKEEMFKMPKNITFVVIPESASYIETISKEMAVNSFNIELQIRENELIREEEVVVKRYPYHNFMATIELEKQHLRLHEESWKKIDDFEETLAMTGEFRVENKTVLQIESFACAMLASGADDVEVFDAALATKIIPTVKSYKLTKNGKLDDVVMTAVERHFDVDLIPTTLKALKKNN